MKKLLFITVIFMLLFSLTFGGRGIAEAAEPVRIGGFWPYVGPLSQLGIDARNAFKLCLDEYKYRVANREILFIDEDTGGKGEVALVKARKLVDKDRVHILAGLINSAEAYAVRDFVVENKVPLVIAGAAGATQLTKELRSPFIFRASFANGQRESAVAWYVYSKKGIKKVVMISSDFVAGREHWAGFKKTFELLGGNVLEEIWAPLGTNDYAPYLAKLANFVGKAEMVWVFIPGSDGIRFINQSAEYGLKEKLKLLCEEGTTEEPQLPSEKDAALGVESWARYVFSRDTPENKSFVIGFQKKYDYDPGAGAEAGYTGAKFIVKALEAVKGKIENQEAFLKALRVVKFEAPRGPVRFDDHQNIVFNTYIQRVEKRGGKYNNYVIDMIPDVDQYWMPKK
jgi:branched-chain amino acid transport system substrate-binding protein